MNFTNDITHSDKISQERPTLQEQVANLNEQINTEFLSEKVPTLSIKMDTFLDLNDPYAGWRFESPDSVYLEKIMDKKMVTLAVVGMYDVGKSWFCNAFTGKRDFNAGYTQKTDGLNFSFQEEYGNLVAVLDTPGSNEAIRVTDPELM